MVITNSNRAYFVKMLGRGLQEGSEGPDNGRS
jgi:hypothetical protein